MQNSPRAKKAARTRAKNARIRAANAEVRSAAALSEKSLIEKRAKAYGEMESRVCDLARGASLAMAVFEDPELFLFAVGRLDAMTERFGLRYYAAEFPPE